MCLEEIIHTPSFTPLHFLFGTLIHIHTTTKVKCFLGKIIAHAFKTTVKLGNKERFDKEQIGIKELFMDYQPFYTINLLLDKELLPI